VIEERKEDRGKRREGEKAKWRRTHTHHPELARHGVAWIQDLTDRPRERITFE